MTDTVNPVAQPAVSGLWPPNVISCDEILRPDLLDDVDAHAETVGISNAVAVRQGLVHIPTIARADLPRTVSLAHWQTGFRNQEQRGSCYAFAAVAAMEAAYRRQHGVTLDLSEQFAFHLNKAGELYPSYESSASQHENNSSYWGFQGASDIIEKLARSAIPDESAARYLLAAEMEALRVATPGAGDLVTADSTPQSQLDAFEFAEGHIPTAARHVARYRVDGCRALGGFPSNEDVQRVLASGHEVIADVPGHCYLIVGYDLNTGEWLVKNSWNENAFIRVRFDDANRRILGGHYVTSVVAPDSPPAVEAWWGGRWFMDHDGWKGELLVRRTTDYRQPGGQPTKLGTYFRDGQSYDVNGLVEDDGRQLHFWIADTTGRVPAGEPVGQEFRSYLYSWEPRTAAGVTTWSGAPFGVSMSRDPIAGDPTGEFEPAAWLGVWEMNHDGWHGRLEISSLSPLVASYVPDGGSPLQVSGTVDAAAPYQLALSIAFPGNDQPFRLLAHTWECTRFSGTTVWDGRTFGVQGTKR